MGSPAATLNDFWPAGQDLERRASGNSRA